MNSKVLHCDFAARDAARAEIERYRVLRCAQTKKIIAEGMTPDELRLVQGFAVELSGFLGDLWRRFLSMPVEQQVASLDEKHFQGMPWQSLIQCNPFARLPRWSMILPRVAPRAEEPL